jgi:hypothetical protein
MSLAVYERIDGDCTRVAREFNGGSFTGFGSSRGSPRGSVLHGVRTGFGSPRGSDGVRFVTGFGRGRCTTGLARGWVLHSCPSGCPGRNRSCSPRRCALLVVSSGPSSAIGSGLGAVGVRRGPEVAAQRSRGGFGSCCEPQDCRGGLVVEVLSAVAVSCARLDFGQRADRVAQELREFRRPKPREPLRDIGDGIHGRLADLIAEQTVPRDGAGRRGCHDRQPQFLTKLPNYQFPHSPRGHMDPQGMKHAGTPWRTEPRANPVENRTPREPRDEPNPVNEPPSNPRVTYVRTIVPRCDLHTGPYPRS